MTCITSLDHLVLTVADIGAAVAFYCGVLGCEEITFANGRKAVGFGTQKINLHLKGNEVAPHALMPVCGSADLCFLTEMPLEEVIELLHKNGIEPELGPVLRAGAQGPIQSVYCRDPDGNLIEISNRC